MAFLLQMGGRIMKAHGHGTEGAYPIKSYLESPGCNL